MRTDISERVERHRAKLREAGLRPIQLWVPDTKRKGFAKECKKQSLLLKVDPQEREIAAWLETIADKDGWH